MEKLEINTEKVPNLIEAKLNKYLNKLKQLP